MEVVLLDRGVWEGKGQINYLGKGRVFLEDQGQEKTIEVNCKMNFIQDFPCTLSVPSTHCLKSSASHKKCIFLKN